MSTGDQGEGEPSFVVIDDLDDENPDSPAGDTFVCQHCNVVLHGQNQWEEHKKTKNHLKKEELKSSFSLDEKDMLVDVTTLTYKAIQNSKTMFIGADCIVTDRATEEIKCLMCRVLLKDSPTVLIHLRSAKHIHVFFKSRFPEMYREVQKKAKNRQEIQNLVARYADEFVRKFGGKKEPRVYQKGYYDSLSADRRGQVEEIVERRNVEIMEMSMYRRRERSASREKERPREERSRSRRSPSPRRRSPHRDRHSDRSYSRDRDRERDRERHYHHGHSRDRERSYDRGDRDFRDPYMDPHRLPPGPDLYHRHRSRSPPPTCINHRRNVPINRFKTCQPGEQCGPATLLERRYEDPLPLPPVMSRRDEDWRSVPPKLLEERRTPPPATRPPLQAHSLSSMRKEMAEVDVDKLEELPTEFEIFDTLCNAEMVEIEKDERAFIQDFIDDISAPVIGVDYMAEYSDWKGQYEPGYLCTLCECRLNPAQAVRHVVNEKHTMNYMKRHYPKKFTALCIGTLGEEVRRQMKNKYLQEIATTEPKRLITQKIVLPSHSRQVFRRHKQIASARNPPKEVVETKEEPAPISKPAMIYSEKAMRAKELAEIAKTLPLHCEKNLEEGWYSVRSKTIEYYEKLALEKNPNALYFSIRDPQGKEEFYGEWNPSLMRRLQDKFNFRLEHVRWLQKLLSDWKVPMYTPLQMTDLRPLEQEVEGAVLNELIDMVLKPVSTLRYMQTFEYENYDDEMRAEEEQKRREEEERRREEMERKKRLEEEERLREEAERLKKEESKRRMEEAQQQMKKAQRAKAAAAVEKRIAEVNMDAESGPEIKVRRVVEDRDDRRVPVKKAEEKPPAEPPAPASLPLPPKREESEKEKKLRVLIESVLRVAKQQGQQHKNAILQMVVNFPNAPEILFRLATRQPAQLQQLVTVAKNPMLTIPPGILEQLHKKLKEVEAEAEEERIQEERRREEEAKELEQKKQEESRSRIETARAELLKARKDEEQRRQAMDVVSSRKPEGQALQILTPKLPPGQPNPSAHLGQATVMESMMSAALRQGVPPFSAQVQSGMPGGGMGIIPGYSLPSAASMGAPRLSQAAVPPFWALPRVPYPQRNPRFGYF